MPVYFRTPITEDVALALLNEMLSDDAVFDGYFNVFGKEGELNVSWNPPTGAAEFKAEVTDALQSLWLVAPFWLVYRRSDDRNDLSINEVRKAAIRLTRPYAEASVVTLCLLGRVDDKDNLEIILISFRDEAERRNFRVRYEGRFVADA